MKKLLVIPAVIGLLAVPSIALASHGADDNTSNNVRREDRTAVPVNTSVLPTEQSSSNVSHEVEDDNDHSQAVIPAGSISLDEAKVVALGVYPDKTFKKVEIEQEHGALVYSVRFTDSSRVDVRASDGAVVRSEAENDEDDNSNASGSHSDDDSEDSDDDNSNRRSDD